LARVIRNMCSGAPRPHVSDFTVWWS